MDTCSARANQPYTYTQGSAFTAARRCNTELSGRHDFLVPHDHHAHNSLGIIDTARINNSIKPLKISQKLSTPAPHANDQDLRATTEIDPAILKDLTQTLETSPRKRTRPRGSDVEKRDLGKPRTHSTKQPINSLQTIRPQAKHSLRSYFSFNDLQSLPRTGFHLEPRDPHLMQSISGPSFPKSSSASLGPSYLSLETPILPSPPISSHRSATCMPVLALDGVQHSSCNDGSMYLAPTLKQKRSLKFREQNRIIRDLRIGRRRDMGPALGKDRR